MMPMYPALLEHKDRLFLLQGWKNKEKIYVLTTEPVTGEVMRNAWVHAVRYTATALDQADHEAAKKMLLQRHPSWTLIESVCMTVECDLNAGVDVPEA